MSDITIVDKMNLEKLFQMNSGYVLDLSNRTFQNFILSSVGIDIYEEGKYVDFGTSKANRLRAFWDKEPNSISRSALKIVIRARQSAVGNRQSE